ncbi:SpoIIE family protein phosphatase [Streptomyces sp. QHH-9511]|uniref:ATP-binding SpoIIE family protein phosphatase n=1 Tax=Streptomyces sp. QHH-9511 TaxID=2684468 RepID=UPI0013181283|nr:SpoIIE family protein phosphatase [Streptomyces sp. QHH-9511]QGZ52192.1 SpoIIE family protein phosphatase [Streptomyces sp. QHH-9511]
MNGGKGRRRLAGRASAGRGAVAHRVAGARMRLGRSGGEVPLDRITTRGRLAWLNAAGSRIGTTLDLERTAQELAEFTVPGFADGAAVDILESVLRGDEGSRWTGTGVPLMRATALCAVEELASLEPTPVGETFVRAEEAHETLLHRYCLRQGRPVLVSRMRNDDFIKVAPTESAAAKMRAAGVHSYLAVPLIARGLLLGSADFVRGPGRPPFSTTDLALAEQLASQAAVYIDNARLYGREREHVVSLQRTLLPRVTPVTPGLRVHAEYAPSTAHHGVGGDWYDVMALPGGRTALMVGDVMGHGLPAAATMGRLRTVARTLMTLDMAPERVLARLDLATRDLEDEQVATFLCAVFDPADSTYTLASAGHLPPLLLDGQGSAEFADVPVGAPLGAGVIPYDPIRLKMPAGGNLVMYTDGLVKSRDSALDHQLECLRAAARGLTPEALEGGGLIECAPADASRFDEAVLLVATTVSKAPTVSKDSTASTASTASAVPADLREWQLPQEGRAASVARRLVTDQLAAWDLTELADVCELVVSELVGNALRYGNGPGRLRLLRGERLVVEVSDTGPDLPQIQHADLSDEGGRGLQLINMLCRRWGSCRTVTGKVVWAEQNLPS